VTQSSKVRLPQTSCLSSATRKLSAVFNTFSRTIPASVTHPINIFPIPDECSLEGVLILDYSSVTTRYSDHQYFGRLRDSYRCWQTNGRMESRRGEAYMDTHGRA